MSDDRTGATVFAESLESYGVSRVFGNPGTTELPLVGAVTERELEYVLCLHEDVAVGAAAGYAANRRWHDGLDPATVGVVNLHNAPGLAHGLGNLYGAWMAGAPVLATAGVHGTDFQHEEPKLSGDVVEMAADVTKWSAEVKRVEALPAMLRRAVRAAVTPPAGPVFLGLPLDVLRSETDARPEPIGAIPDAGRGDPDALDRSAQLLADAGDVAVVVGDRAAASPGIDDAVARLASATGARVHTEVLTSAVGFPFSHERFDSPLLPDKRAAEQMDADAVVWIDCTTNTTLTRHDEPLVPPGAASIHVGADPAELGKTVPVDVAVAGDPGRVVAALADRLSGRDPDPTPATRWNDEYSPTIDPTGGDGSSRVGAIVRGVRSAVPDALVIDESSSNKYEVFRAWPLAPGQYLGNKGAGLGYGSPVAVGAALAERDGGEDRPVACIIGDGSYLYYPGAVYTAARRDLDVRFVVLDNGEYRILKENAAAMFGGSPAERDLAGTDFEPPIDVAASARAYGVEAETVEAPGDVARAVGREGPRVLVVNLRD